MPIGKNGWKSVAAAVLLMAAFGCSDGLDKETELQEVMQSDLLRLAAAQEATLGSTGAYTTDVRSIMEPTPGVNLSVKFVSVGTWGAEAANAESQHHCAMFVGAGESSFLQRWPGIIQDTPMCKPLPVNTGK